MDRLHLVLINLLMLWTVKKEISIMAYILELAHIN